MTTWQHTHLYDLGIIVKDFTVLEVVGGLVVVEVVVDVVVEVLGVDGESSEEDIDLPAPARVTRADNLHVLLMQFTSTLESGILKHESMWYL